VAVFRKQDRTVIGGVAERNKCITHRFSPFAPSHLENGNVSNSRLRIAPSRRRPTSTHLHRRRNGRCGDRPRSLFLRCKCRERRTRQGNVVDRWRKVRKPSMPDARPTFHCRSPLLPLFPRCSRMFRRCKRCRGLLSVRCCMQTSNRVHGTFPPTFF